MERLTIAGIQHACGPDRAANEATAFAMARLARERGATLICFQELFGAIYFPQRPGASEYFGWAEPIPGPATERLGALARELGATLIGSIFERAMGGLFYDCAVVIAPDGSLAGKWRKMHIPDGSGYFEKYYFTPGDTDYPVFAIGAGADAATGDALRLAVPTCWDQWFPEVARICALRGADLICYPTAIGSELDPALAGADTEEAWRTVMRGHAIANCVYVVAVNRVGIEGEIAFYGGSFVADPTGEVVARLDDRPGILLATIDPARLEFARRLSPFWRDRRPETYGTILTKGGR